MKNKDVSAAAAEFNRIRWANTPPEVKKAHMDMMTRKAAEAKKKKKV